MRHCWLPCILAWVSMATPALCQSEDWGAGVNIYPLMATNDTMLAVGDDPERIRDDHNWFTAAPFSPSSSPLMQDEPQLDKCSLYFSTSTRWLKAQKEELAYLQATQHGNKAVVDNLVQLVAEEVGDQSYEEVIKENIIGIQEDQKSCHGVVQQAEEDLQKQLEGDVSGVPTGVQKIREDSVAFDDMLRATVDIANRLEVSSQALHAAFTKQLKNLAKIHR